MVSTAAAAAIGVVGGVTALFAVGWPLSAWLLVRACEKPSYKVLRSLRARRGLLGGGGAEVRLYAPYVYAEAEVGGGGTMREGLSGGWRGGGRTPRLRTRTLLPSTRRPAPRADGFRAIADYIFGNNLAPGGEGKEKVAMTSPVTLEMDTGKGKGKRTGASIAMTSPVTAELPGGDEPMRVTFIMPSKYTLDTLPTPGARQCHAVQLPTTLVCLARPCF